MLPTLLRKRSSRQDPFEAIRQEIESVFDRALTPWSGNGETEDLTATYPVDIREEDNTIHVDAELPGFKSNEVQATLDQGILRIVAEHKEKEKVKGQKHLHERRYTRVERCFTLPTAVDESKIDAKLTDGVLHLSLRKTKEAQPCQITIQ